MKKLLLLVAIGMLPCLTKAQSVNAAPADTAAYTPAETYCVVTPTRPIFGQTVSLDVDYGKTNEPDDDTTLRDSNGKKLKFNTLAQAFNYLAQQGGLFVNTLRYSADESSRYLFRRKIEK
ncbi:hypothetical protein NAF17_16895 [Mucilaginibacter sp. RB4R14]|uniref:hypothetical protein n=1 Tax=Mucilaginibacter aurantiaciroseus TaxID=2949308 RepID=UPI00209062F5|nr:hypothetical protein [Mucilaginibacter aurantiaciroseus]MCO5937226.1 hypothetical protein [Mucilaginibacter aurantiaciroseus]